MTKQNKILVSFKMLFIFQFEQFVVSYMHEVFDMDSLVTSHPIYGPVNTPADMHAIFDFTAYAKVSGRLALTQ